LDASRFAKPETIIERRVFVSFGHVDLGELLLGVLKPVEGLHLAQRCTQRVAVEFCAHPCPPMKLSNPTGVASIGN